MPRLQKFIIIFFLIFILAQFTWPLSVFAINFTPQVSIGDKFQKDSPVSIDSNTIGEYIKTIYKYSIGVVGILATVVMMIGGIMWIAAAGNASRISEAKSWIGAAIIGLVLALSSYMILKTVDTQFVEFRSITPDPVTQTQTPTQTPITPTTELYP